MDVNAEMARDFLQAELGFVADDVELIGSGAWSQCFSFATDDKCWVIRFGKHRLDFEKDREAFRWSSSALPIPELTEIGDVFDGSYAVSSRVFGTPLEMTQREEWGNVMPSMMDTMESLRLAELPTRASWGPIRDPSGVGFASWREYLLDVRSDHSDIRTHGWSKRLEASPRGQKAFDGTFQRLQALDLADVPMSLTHGDLINRNVYVSDGKISGVFDWGCATYGDHMYDLAWLEFWEPWYPNLDIDLLQIGLESRWRQNSYEPSNLQARRTACLLHIALVHLAYGAYRRDWDAQSVLIDRMQTLFGSS